MIEQQFIIHSEGGWSYRIRKNPDFDYQSFNDSGIVVEYRDDDTQDFKEMMTLNGDDFKNFLKVLLTINNMHDQGEQN